MPSKSLSLDLYRRMCEIREFEWAAARFYKEGVLPGFIHLSLGQEACAAGVCANLTDIDYVTSTHRGHGHCLAKGASPRKMMAELFAKREGYGRGRGGSMHIADVSKGVLGANGIVGQSMGLAVGAALSLQVQRREGCVVAFFGEGASGAGIAHEAMNIAALWQLPLVFFCESNRYAELSPYSKHVSVETLAIRSAAYGFPGDCVDGEDVFAVYDVVRDACERARAGGGPTLIEAKVARWHGHYEGDPQTYKTSEERENPAVFDPIRRFEQAIKAEGAISDSALEDVRNGARDTIRDAVDWALSLDEPSPNAIYEDVYGE